MEMNNVEAACSPETAGFEQSLLYLWEPRVLFIGRLGEPVRFFHAASSLVVSLGEPLRVQQAGRPAVIRSRSFLLPACLPIAVETHGAPIAICYLDVFRYDYHLLVSVMKRGDGDVLFDLDREADALDLFQRIHRLRPAAEECFRWISALVNPPDLQGRFNYPIDPRIVRAVELIQATAPTNFSIAFLAGQLNISVPRLVQLFRQYIAVPVRRYRQWHRLHRTILNIAAGSPSFTDAAVAAGFADVAHFSNTFKNMLGISPSTFFAVPTRTQFIVDPNLLRNGFGN